MSKRRMMIELINKEDALDACSAQVWEGEAFADITCIKPVLTIPENPTNGDMIKAIFPKIDFYDMAFTVHATTSVISNGVKGGVSYDFWKDWWNAPYKAESEE